MNQTATRLLRMKQLQEIVPMHRVTIWRMTQDGRFPAPVRISARSVAWKSDEIEAWLNSRPACQ